MKKLILLLALFFPVISMASIQGINSCDAYFLLKNGENNISYTSFTGRKLTSVKVSDFQVYDALKAYKKSVQSFCDLNEKNKKVIYDSLNLVSKMKYLDSVYYNTDDHSLNVKRLSSLTSNANFISSDYILLIASSDYIGNEKYNLKLSYLRAIDTISKLVKDKNIILINLGEEGQDENNNSDFYLKQNRSVKIFGVSNE